MKRIAELQLFDCKTMDGEVRSTDDLIVERMRAGDLRSNGATKQKYHALLLLKEYEELRPLDDIVEDFFSRLGGTEAVRAMQDSFQPRQSFLRFHIPARTSELNQDDVLSMESLAVILEARLAIDLWFT